MRGSAREKLKKRSKDYNTNTRYFKCIFFLLVFFISIFLLLFFLAYLFESHFSYNEQAKYIPLMKMCQTKKNTRFASVWVGLVGRSIRLKLFLSCMEFLVYFVHFALCLSSALIFQFFFSSRSTFSCISPFIYTFFSSLSTSFDMLLQP